MIRGRVQQLTDEDWQNRGVALGHGGSDPWGKARFARGSVHTRIYRGACIFHNRPDHPAGAGCALHLAALRRGEDPIDWKPRICWQVPLFFESDPSHQHHQGSRLPDGRLGSRGDHRVVVHRAPGGVYRRPAGVPQHGAGTTTHVRRRRL